tara:strand:+ start:432 stop:578 length:147 start_codon:yes stop_codon:yes gene_type:complete
VEEALAMEFVIFGLVFHIKLKNSSLAKYKIKLSSNIDANLEVENLALV